MQRKIYIIYHLTNRTMKRLLLVSALICALFALPVQAQTENHGWFGGVSAGIPSGYSTFRPTKVGYSGGLFAGYRFNRIISLEASARIGRTILGTYDCLADHYIGTDGNHYSFKPEGISSWQYSDLRSYVNLQQYGLQLNVNLLGLFNRTKDSRWRFEIAPMLSAFGTDADIHGARQLNKGTKWHLGVGGNVQVGYWFTNHFGLAVYTEGNHLTGARLDGIPKYRFINNFMGESGIKFAFGFGKQKKAEAVQVVEPVAEPVKVVEPERPVVVETKPVPVVEEPKVEEFEFGNVLFDVNKSNIKESEKSKITEATEYLKSNGDKQVEVTGWTDPTGSKEYNKNLSVRRAKAVKQALVDGGIAANRISTKGNGVKTDAGDDYEQARTAVIEEVK